MTRRFKSHPLLTWVRAPGSTPVEKSPWNVLRGKGGPHLRCALTEGRPCGPAPFFLHPRPLRGQRRFAKKPFGHCTSLSLHASPSPCGRRPTGKTFPTRSQARLFRGKLLPLRTGQGLHSGRDSYGTRGAFSAKNAGREGGHQVTRPHHHRRDQQWPPATSTSTPLSPGSGAGTGDIERG